MNKDQGSHYGGIGVPSGGRIKIGQDSSHSSKMAVEGWIRIPYRLKGTVEW